MTIKAWHDLVGRVTETGAVMQVYVVSYTIIHILYAEVWCIRGVL